MDSSNITVPKESGSKAKANMVLDIEFSYLGSLLNSCQFGRSKQLDRNNGDFQVVRWVNQLLPRILDPPHAKLSQPLMKAKPPMGVIQ